MNDSLNLLFAYYTHVRRNPDVLQWTGASRLDAPYTAERVNDLTVIINAYARPAYLPLIWEACQYQSCRPAETWIIQNSPGRRSVLPSAFLDEVRSRNDTVLFESGLNHGCWFRFFLAALYCRSRYVIILDDDTLPGCEAFATALKQLAIRPGIYGGRGLILDGLPDGPRYWRHTVFGWPTETPEITQVDFAQQFWAMETSWMRELFRHIPHRLFMSPEPAAECGEEMYVSYVGQKLGVPTYVYGHAATQRSGWSSLQGDEMGGHPNAMHLTGKLDAADHYVREFERLGWRLLHYA